MNFLKYMMHFVIFYLPPVIHVVDKRKNLYSPPFVFKIRNFLVKRILKKYGRNNLFWHGVLLEYPENLEIENNVVISHGCHIHAVGGVKIKDNVLLGPGVKIFSFEHEYRDLSKAVRDQDLIYSPILIEEDVWIGANSIILSGVKIGKSSVIGAGAVVTKDVPPYSVWAGNPAKEIKKRKG